MLQREMDSRCSCSTIGRTSNSEIAPFMDSDECPLLQGEMQHKRMMMPAAACHTAPLAY